MVQDTAIVTMAD